MRLRRHQLTLAAVLLASQWCVAGPGFADEQSIIAVSRDTVPEALKGNSVTVSEAIATLTTYRVVSREQYLIYAHQIGVSGSITLESGTFLWQIERDYAAVVTGHNGKVIYLLRPDPKAKLAEGGQQK